MPRKILIPTKLSSVAGEHLRQNGFEVVQDDKSTIGELVAKHPDACGLIVRSEDVTAEVIDGLGSLKLVVRAGAGFDNIDVKHARRKDVDVMNTPGANANAVAEEVVTLILAAYRHLIRGDKGTRAGLWEKKDLMGSELTGKTVGIVGLGNIGQLVVKRLSGFECPIVAYDPVISASRADELNVELTSVEEVFSRADVITLHVPETSETKGMVNAALLAKMKNGAVLVNCARAGVINEDDLREARKKKKILFCNDVYEEDAAGPKSVADIADIMLPHLGASTIEANTTAAKRAAEQMVDYFERGITKYVVNRAIPEGLDQSYQELAYYLTKVARAYLGFGRPPRRIEVSLYGDLKQYAQFFMPPIVLGLSQEFDPVFDYRDAEAYLKGKGISFNWREVDNRKGYGNTVTIDLMEGQGPEYSRVSVRGTIAEGRVMVTRIGEFDKLYFDPIGHSAMVVYKDCPGMLAKITAVFARHGINIDDIRSPHDPRSGDSMAVLKVNTPVPKEILDEIIASSGAKKAVGCSFN